ncbi:Hypothetical predicted protein [Cloeon dipterum]|uniref:Proteasome subunit alpha type n=1 Tax=Cloeon dipterum TaxID=197152 RepID=A0A8S1DDV8_9INSE|nr:Hypothetical predicted protein [Cloeon dipterum]
MSSSRYDRAVTVFSPDGHLLQVEYAQEAVRKGSTAVGVRGKDVVVLGVEKKSVAKLQEERTVRKVCLLDDHIVMAFAGLTADARVLINRAQIECQSHKLTVEDPATLEYITRPFGISCLLGGFDPDGTPRLYQTEPSGIYYEWKANATGHSAKTVLEFLEKYYTPEEVSSERGAVKLAIRALLEVVQSGLKNLEVAVMRKDALLEMLDAEKISQYVTEIEKEKEEEAEKKKQKK